MNSIHSPKLYDFLDSVLEDSRHYYIYGDIEAIRECFLQNHQTVEVQDLGAGSKKLVNPKRKISDIARTSLASRSKIRWLFKMSMWLKASTVVELGSSLGLSAMALAAANSSTQVHTIEGDPSIYSLAKKEIRKSPLSDRIHLINAEFDNALDYLFTTIDKIDLAFVDGNHRYQSTIMYFHRLMEKTTDQSILVFDDIYWSDEMTQAWKQIIKDPRVSLSIDLFHFGVVFLDSSLLPKRNLKLIQRKFKPWKLGLWG